MKGIQFHLYSVPDLAYLACAVSEMCSSPAHQVFYIVPGTQISHTDTDYTTIDCLYLLSSHTQAHHHMCEVVWHQEIMHFRCNQVLIRIAEGGFVVPLILLCDSTALNDEKVIVEHLF